MDVKCAVFHVGFGVLRIKYSVRAIQKNRSLIMSKCIFTTGSVTQAMKAKRILAEHSIPVSTTKISSARDRRGCIYGIEFSCAQNGNISRVLSFAGISYDEYTE